MRAFLSLLPEAIRHKINQLPASLSRFFALVANIGKNHRILTAKHSTNAVLTSNFKLPYNRSEIKRAGAILEEFYTLAEVAEMLKMHIETVREFVRKKELPAYKMSKRDYRVSKADLDEFLRKRRTIDATNNGA